MERDMSEYACQRHYFGVFRLLKDGLVEKVDEFVENGTTKAKYKKTGAVMI